ncbi:DUF4139 domain-containing protein [Mucilaginibacter sp. X4EP1]|uniref:DUF4139 domain-containing protein n=1 Tax=Mucilaginibacter sp. X4EP1 TaxID=2723092 RepID=UPI00216A6169|nr:DUF4139 domain-containing protein [Mucilaginibacter sp. X4EP1]MCS3815871.1 uncharacterized protein (TIGR02231 family) [Mucilaginibacter sp. X4EP1]
MMLRKILMVVCLTITALAAKANDDQKITSKVQKVIVFLNGAQVTRTAMVNVNAGTSELVFGGISPGIDVQSIQVHANGDFTILSVKHEMNYLDEQVKNSQVEQIEAALKVLKDKIDLQNSLISVYSAEENMLMKNQLVKAENAALEVPKLKEALDFQTERLIAIKEKELAINNQIVALGVERQKYNQQLDEINRKEAVSTSNIIVTISSKSEVQSTFSLSYLIHDARWYPSYDIRAKNVNSPLAIIYKANVSQTTGEEWKNVRLTLSTGNPYLNNNKPELNPYYLNIYQYEPKVSADKSLAEVVVVSASGIKRTPEQYGYLGNDDANGPNVAQTENQTNVDFNIDNPYTIASDGKESLVEINQVEVKANYQYYVAPKLNTNVFLTAQVTDWSKYNFLAGEVNIFFEGTYIGKSRMDTQALNDTLNLSLGVDKGILVTRTSRKDLTERQTFGSNKKETKDWLIEVKNRKNQPINLLVEDQVPVSQNSSIEVETQNVSDGKLDQTTGKVSWNLSLKPSDDKKIELKYQVKYPKNQTVIVQ